jgi:molecular chaperone DnaJ/curved DNA-binding protein
MNRDYYKILGIPRGADDKEIKAAYRRLARQYHPDVNPGSKEAEAKFKEISEAYQVLSDPEKRRKYDQFGADWENGGFTWTNPNAGEGVTFGPGGFGDLFEHLFQGFGGAGTMNIPSDDIIQEVELTLEEVMKGAKRTIAYQVNELCPQCRGAGQVRTTTGRPAACPQCGGARVNSVSRTVTVTIPAGVADGTKLRVPSQGNKGSNGRAGDLYALIKVLPHPVFKRVGDDLEVEVSVFYLDALLGGQVRVETMSGVAAFPIPEGTQPGQKFRLKGKGMPKKAGGTGDLYARVRIEMPRELTPREKALLGELRSAQGAGV